MLWLSRAYDGMTRYPLGSSRKWQSEQLIPRVIQNLAGRHGKARKLVQLRRDLQLLDMLGTVLDRAAITA